MKKLLLSQLLFTFFMVICSCKKEKTDTIENVNSIIGNWELIEEKHGTGAKIIEEKVDLEYILSFYNNGKYREYVNGKQIDDQYLLTKKDLIVLINSKTSDSSFYRYNFEESKLHLNETDHNGILTCDEGCVKIFKKLEK